jgi:Acetyltransferase (GNAT) domain
VNWQPSLDAIELLEARGGPFDSLSYRRAVVETLPGMTDMSWAATAEDGTTAAVALVGSRGLAEALPPSGYGMIVATRSLTATAASSFLSAARRAAGAHRMVFRTVALPAGEEVDLSFAQVTGQASVVETIAGRDHREGFRRLAVRSLRKAEAAGATVRTTADAAAFLDLYAQASAQWTMKYPHALILRLGEAGVARFDEVWLEGAPVSALMTLRGGGHWMCWLAAQNEAGRAASASYLAYDTVLREAAAAVRFVSFGASAPGTQGLEFKRRLGATEVPIHQWQTSGVLGKLLQMPSKAAARMRS